MEATEQEVNTTHDHIVPEESHLQDNAAPSTTDDSEEPQRQDAAAAVIDGGISGIIALDLWSSIIRRFDFAKFLHNPALSTEEAEVASKEIEDFLDILRKARHLQSQEVRENIQDVRYRLPKTSVM